MKVYFAHSTLLYNTDYEIKCINLIKKEFGKDCDVINPNSDYFKLPEKNKEMSSRKYESKILKEIFIPIINECNVFVYTFNNNNKLTGGVRNELDYALKNKKDIYRIFINNDDIGILKMDMVNIKNTVRKYKNKKENWILKSIDDYEKWFKNNKEVVDLFKSQFVDYGTDDVYISHGLVSHRNSLYDTDEHDEVVFANCKNHNIKHSFIDPRYQSKLITCPFDNNTRNIPSYSTFKFDSIYDLNLKKALSSRTIHKTMYIYDEDAFKVGKGMALRDNNGNALYNKQGKVLADYDKIHGVEPLFDLDIVKNGKDAHFFNMKIFNQYNETLDIIFKYLDNKISDIDYKTGFSGNGMYVILEPMMFSEFDMNFFKFANMWKKMRNDIQSLMDKKNINHVIVEKRYGWQRYFKIMGSFHGSRERVSIPLNKDESLDYKWMDYITKIENGLEGNVINEIIKRSGWVI